MGETYQPSEESVEAVAVTQFLLDGAEGESRHTWLGVSQGLRDEYLADARAVLDIALAAEKPRIEEEMKRRAESDEAIDAARVGSGVRGRLTAENTRNAIRAALSAAGVKDDRG